MAIEGQSQPSYWCGQQLRIQRVSPTGEATEVQLDQPFALVGSHADCDVHVDDASVDARTLFVCATASGVVVVVLSSRAKKAGQAYRVPADRRIPLGKWSLSFSAEPSDQPAPTPPDRSFLYCLTWKSDSVRRYVQLRPDYPLILGRRRPAGIVLADNRMSSLHCAVLRSGDGCWAVDLSSTNGTWSGGERRRVHRVGRDRSFVVGNQRVHFTQLYSHTKEQELSAEVLDLRDRIERMQRCQIETIEDATVQQAALLASLRGTQDQLTMQRARLEGGSREAGGDSSEPAIAHRRAGKRLGVSAARVGGPRRLEVVDGRFQT